MIKKEDNKVSIQTLKDFYDSAKSAYSAHHRRMKLIKAIDDGELWKAINAKFPSYQILPDTNFISYIKDNIAASIYTVVKSADVQPTSDKDKEIIVQLNIALENIWDTRRVGDFQLKAGLNAALTNIGITQVGWSESVVRGAKDSIEKGNIVLKNISPIKFMRDPYAPSLQESAYCIYYDNFHKSVFLQNKLYKESFKEYLQKNEGTTPEPIPSFKDNTVKATQKDYHTLIIFWVKNDTGGIDEIHTLGATHILHYKSNITPNRYPFAIVHCNDPGESPVGVSPCAKAIANDIAYNLLDSIALTSEYKNQRPPKFISATSGLNVAAFAQHGDDADRAFVVNGDPSRAVQYQEFPKVSPIYTALKMGLQEGVQVTTGVDDKYSGRNTGSITTTGGIEEMLNRVTVIDTPKIRLYESYTRDLTELILSNYLEHAPKRKYLYRKPDSTRWETVEVDFPSIDVNTIFNYKINISSELPNNKQRIAQMANMLMEKQMQYAQSGESVELITAEEWLMFQDLPNKEFMLERMGIQRLESDVEKVAQTLFNYTGLVQQGMDPNEAILATAKTLSDQRKGIVPEEGPVPGAVPESMMGGQGGPIPPGIM